MSASKNVNVKFTSQCFCTQRNQASVNNHQRAVTRLDKNFIVRLVPEFASTLRSPYNKKVGVTEEFKNKSKKESRVNSHKSCRFIASFASLLQKDLFIGKSGDWQHQQVSSIVHVNPARSSSISTNQMAQNKTKNIPPPLAPSLPETDADNQPISWQPASAADGQGSRACCSAAADRRGMFCGLQGTAS